MEARFVCIFLLSHLHIGEMYKLGRARPWNWQCLSNSIWGKFNLVTSFPLNLTVPKCLSPVFSGNQGNTVNGTHLSRDWLTRNSTSVRISLFSSFLMVRLKFTFDFHLVEGLKIVLVYFWFCRSILSSVFSFSDTLESSSNCLLFILIEGNRDINNRKLQITHRLLQFGFEWKITAFSFKMF